MKKSLQAILMSLCCVMCLATSQTAAAETFKSFMDALGKGQQATFSGELVVTYRSSGYIYLQDETAGMMMRNTDCDMQQGYKVTNVQISRSQYGAAVYSCKGYDKVGENATIAPIVCKINELPKYPYMLVTLTNLEFENAGHTFGLTSEGAPMEQPVMQNGIDGMVKPFESNLVNAIVPKVGDVTGVDVISGVAPRSVDDLKVVVGADLENDNTFAHFLKTLTFTVPGTFKGELIVTYVDKGNSTTVCYQDDTAGAMFFTGDTQLKAGDKITNVVIAKDTEADVQMRHSIRSYELVAENCTVTPKVINYGDLYVASPTSYMMVTINDVNIKPNASGLMGVNEKFLIYPDGTTPNTAAFSTDFCNALVGESLPLRANITGVNFYGYVIRPIEASQLEGVGSAEVKVTDVNDINSFRAMANPQLIRLTDEVKIVQTDLNADMTTGFFVIEDNTGGLQVRVERINFPELKEGTIVKNMILSCNNAYNMPMLSKINDKSCDVVSENNIFEPKVIKVGDFNATTKVAMDYTLVCYKDVEVNTEDKVFDRNLMYTISGNGKTANLLPNYLAADVKVPEGKCDITGIVYYNTILSKYVIAPRSSADIVSGGSKAEFVTESAMYPVYNMQGIKVAEKNDEATMRSLPSGVYIVNGKKILK